MDEIDLIDKIPSYKLDVLRTRTRAQGALTDSEAVETLESRKPLFEYCYEDALLKNRDVHGQGIWDLKTDKKGAVIEFKMRADESTIKDHYLQRCIAHHLLRTRFPASIKGDSEIVVNLLFSILKN
jgi:hypothetical protein